MSDKDYIPTFGKELFEPITIEFLSKQLQAKTDENTALKQQLDKLKQSEQICSLCKADRVHSNYKKLKAISKIRRNDLKTLKQDNKILIEALELSISTLSNCRDEVKQFNKYMIDKTIDIAKTALDRIKTTQTPSDLVQ